jgi:spore coat protein CotF
MSTYHQYPYNYRNAFTQKLSILEVHALLKVLEFKTITLSQIKNRQSDINDLELQKIAVQGSELLQRHIREIIFVLQSHQFYCRDEGTNNPVPNDDGLPVKNDQNIAAEILYNIKAAIPNISVAVSETVSSSIRAILTNQLNNTILYLEQVLYYMLAHDYYPVYDIDQLVAQGIQHANVVLKMP